MTARASVGGSGRVAVAVGGGYAMATKFSGNAMPQVIIGKINAVRICKAKPVTAQRSQSKAELSADRCAIHPIARVQTLGALRSSPFRRKPKGMQRLGLKSGPPEHALTSASYP